MMGLQVTDDKSKAISREEYFKIYEDCKRKYSFGEISESEFRKIVISATNDLSLIHI